LRQNVLFSKTSEAQAQVKKWIVELESDQFLTRHAAFENLQQHLDDAIDELKAAQPKAPPESQMRIEELLKSATGVARPSRAAQVLKVLRNIDTPQAKALLKELSEAQPNR